MNARPLLLALRRGLVRVLGAIDSATAEPEKLPDENELLERAKRQNRAGRRASRTPWYHHRPGEVKVPDSLKYFEALHGTKATIEMLKRQERKLDE